MKIKVISRNEDDYSRDTTLSIYKNVSNPDPNLHRFEKAREIVRAVNASKFQRIMAKPFVADLSGHSDTPLCLAAHPKSVRHLISGSADGEIRVWDLAVSRTIETKTLWTIRHAHNGFVNGIVAEPSGNSFYTCSVDMTLKIWSLDTSSFEGGSQAQTPVQTYTHDRAIYCIDHHYSSPILATGGDKLAIWDSQRCVVKQTWSPANVEVIRSLRFNKAQQNLVALTARDKSIHIYDTTSGTTVSKLVMQMKSNGLCWNPMQPFHFTIANEDFNCYTFDMRKLETGPLIMHVGHVNAVLDVDYSPTGQEFVSGSYDQTVRIFRTDSTSYNSREIYHTRRMRRVYTVRYSLDGKYVFSGSDDQAIRIWKSVAWDPIRPTMPSEKLKLNYQEQLVDRYKDLEQVRSIAEHRHVPKHILERKKRKLAITRGQERRARNYVRYSVSKKQQEGPNKVQKQTTMRKNFLGAFE